jgi:hypothetical protein
LTEVAGHETIAMYETDANALAVTFDLLQLLWRVVAKK